MINLAILSEIILLIIMLPITAYFIAGIINVIRKKESSIILRQQKKIRKLQIELEKRKNKEVK
ncbi:Spiroplasmavirus-related protein [Spiroplasma melliferum]|uniref:Uncharacterized protein n=2 Tax=Spiroplasma melliferum TaxID=2134 RepID=A0AAI9X1D9_SPIME|nr:hypothetical protein SPM_002005 [Spiroplasma melliferum KC3]QCO24437.1 Spiroplasmavirus-related protein [Spiroplasma melliferum]